MQDIIQKIENADWQNITQAMHQNGYAFIPKLLSDEQCEMLKAGYDNMNAYRKRINPNFWGI